MDDQSHRHAELVDLQGGEVPTSSSPDGGRRAVSTAGLYVSIHCPGCERHRPCEVLSTGEISSQGPGLSVEAARANGGGGEEAEGFCAGRGLSSRGAMLRQHLNKASALGMLMAPLVIGCADGSSSSSSSAAVRDSAGIAIVESSAPLWGPGEGWTVDPEPFLDLAGSGPIEDLAELDARMIHEFSEVRDAARLPNGGIAVMDSYTKEIRFFSATGDHLWTVGRSGEGPGEFSRLWSLDRYRTDSLVAFDFELQRATVISPLGEVARVIPRVASVFFVKDLIPLADGTLLIQPTWQGIEVYEGEFGMIPPAVVTHCSAFP